MSWRAIRQLSPTPRVWTLAAGVALMMIVGVVQPGVMWLALLLDLLLLGALTVDGWLAHRHPLELERHLPDTLYQGQEQQIRLEVANPGGRAVRLRLRETLAPELVADPITLNFTLPAGRRGSHALSITPRNRGCAELDPSAVRVRGPLGLAWMGRSMPTDRTARILPRIRLPGQAGLLLHRLVQRRGGASIRNRAGVSTELHGLRDYVPGDEYRNIDWKATARRQRPVTRERAWSQHQSLVILLDCGRPMAARAQLAGQGRAETATWSKLDHALTSALHLMRVAQVQGDRATLVLFSKEIRQVLRVERRSGSLRRVFEQVHAEQPDQEEPDYLQVAAWVGAHIQRQSLVLLCSSVVDLVRAELLAGALAALARHHWPVLVDLEDPALLRLAHSVPESELEAHAKVSAMALLQANRQLAARLGARGVQRLGVSAERLTVDLIQHYLDTRRSH